MPHFLSVEEIANSIDLRHHEPTAARHWFMVKQQAIRHTREASPGELLERQRPNESDFIRDYRMANYRCITGEGVTKFNDKVARIINGSGYTFSSESAEFKEWRQNVRLPAGNGETVSFNEYFSRVVLPASFEDPNALLVAFPYNPDNPMVPPANTVEEGGLMDNVPVGIATKIIPSEKIKWISKNAFAWKAGYWDFQHENKTLSEPFFFIADNRYYYRLIPVGYTKDRNSRSMLKYELQLWYFHDTGSGTGPDETHELPLNVLGGTLTKDQDDDKIVYNSSFIKSYFEYGDEVIVIFSDWQAVRTKTSYPVKVMKKQPCMTCSGNGKVKYKHETGEGLRECDSCGGSGIQKDIGPFTTLYVDAGAGFNKDNPSVKALEYISPDINTVEYLERSWRSLLKDADQSINLDLLESGNESGVAMGMRLQDLHDMLLKIAGNTFDVMELYSWFVECLLNPNRSQRVKPVIRRPKSFEIKSESQLMAEAKEAVPADAVTSLMEFYRAKYSGNPDLIRVKELALLYAPLLAIQDINEINTRIATGAYSASDLIKRDRAELVLTEMLRDGFDLFGRSINDIFAELDRRIEIFLPIPPTPLV